MYREILKQLDSWYNKNNAKPLILTGSKKVGKSWIANDFGEGYFNNVINISMKEDNCVTQYAKNNTYRTDEIVYSINDYASTFINLEDYLIIFDDIDNEYNYSAYIEYICKYMSEYRIIFITSLKPECVLEASNLSYVDILNMYPISFGEFLLVNQRNDLCQKVEKYKDEPICDADILVLEEYLKTYLVVGGMPEAVQAWITTKSISEVNKAKQSIYDEYINTIKNIGLTRLQKKVMECFISIPKQLNSQNKKFQYDEVKLTARKREYYEGVEWLINNRFAYPVYRITEPKSPMKDYIDEKSFKLYLPDIGMLSMLYSIDNIASVDDMLINEQALIESFTYTELSYNANIEKLCFWISTATARIEFVFEDSGIIIPIEVNITGNTKAQSLRVYKQKYNNILSVRIVLSNVEIEKDIINVPAYAIWNL